MNSNNNYNKFINFNLLILIRHTYFLIKKEQVYKKDTNNQQLLKLNSKDKYVEKKSKH